MSIMCHYSISIKQYEQYREELQISHIIVETLDPDPTNEWNTIQFFNQTQTLD